LRNQNTDMQTCLKDTVSTVRRIETAIGNASYDLGSIQSITEDVATMRRELQLFRSGLNVTNVTLQRRPEILGGQMEIKLHTLEKYLLQIRTTGGYVTDEELWEMAWDYVEAYKVVGPLLFRTEGWQFCEILLRL
jgi:hypothetical protein